MKPKAKTFLWRAMLWEGVSFTFEAMTHQAWYKAEQLAYGSRVIGVLREDSKLAKLKGAK